MNMNENQNRGEIIIYRAEDNTIQLDVRMENEMVWLTQDQMAALFGRDRTVIGRHIRNVFKEDELDESLVCAKFALPKKYGRREGFAQEVESVVYNLDVIISVGYRVKSQRGVQFRQWARQSRQNQRVHCRQISRGGTFRQHEKIGCGIVFLCE